MYKKTHRWLLACLTAAALLISSSAQAAIVEQLTLADMTDRADNVFRGVLQSMEPGTVSIGGGELPIVEYTFAVSDYIKGATGDNKSDALVTVRMIGDMKGAVASEMQHYSMLPSMPSMSVGGDYVLFLTPTSAAGLSAPVGLAQGAFTLTETQSGEANAMNGLGNRGLFPGAVSYSELKAAIYAAQN